MVGDPADLDRIAETLVQDGAQREARHAAADFIRDSRTKGTFVSKKSRGSPRFHDHVAIYRHVRTLEPKVGKLAAVNDAMIHFRQGKGPSRKTVFAIYAEQCELDPSWQPPTKSRSPKVKRIKGT